MNPTKPAQERRISVRTNLLGVAARISRDCIKWEDIAIRDISEGGLGFYAHEEYKPGEILMLQGEAHDLSRSTDITCDMELVFASKTPDGGRYLYGSRFLNMTKEQQTTLSVIVELMVTKFPGLLLQ